MKFSMHGSLLAIFMLFTISGSAQASNVTKTESVELPHLEKLPAKVILYEQKPSSAVLEEAQSVFDLDQPRIKPIEKLSSEQEIQRTKPMTQKQEAYDKPAQLLNH